MALKTVYKICCSTDILKTFVVTCIASTDNKGITSYESHHFSTYTNGLKTLLQWLLNQTARMSVWNLLVNTGSMFITSSKRIVRLSLLSLNMLRLSVEKTDKKDAKWIDDLFKHDLVAGSFMPSADIRQIRDLMGYRFKLTCFKSNEKNLLQYCLTVSNIQFLKQPPY